MLHVENSSLLKHGGAWIAAKDGAGSGLWYEVGELNLTDVMVGPCLCSVARVTARR